MWFCFDFVLTECLSTVEVSNSFTNENSKVNSRLLFLQALSMYTGAVDGQQLEIIVSKNPAEITALMRLIWFWGGASVPSMLCVIGKVSVGRPVILQQEER